MRFICAALLSLQHLLVNSTSTIVVDIGTRRPEGISVIRPEDAPAFGLGDHGTIVIRGEVYWAGIQAVNVNTGNTKQIVNGTNTIHESMLMGVHYHRGMIWAAGGGPQFLSPTAVPEVRLYDPVTGALKLACAPNEEPPATNFLNDMTFTNGKVYITNSFRNSIMVLDEESALDGQCVVDAIDTPAEFFSSTEFGANGIAFYNDGLIIPHHTSGAVYFLDLANNNTVSELLPVNTSVTGDGFALSTEDDTLYLAENINEKSEIGLVSAWQLGKDDEGMTTVKLRGNLMDPNFDSPATVALSGDMLYTVNGRFVSVDFTKGLDATPGFAERFQIVGVNRLDFDGGEKGEGESNAEESPENEGVNTTTTQSGGTNATQNGGDNTTETEGEGVTNNEEKNENEGANTTENEGKVDEKQPTSGALSTTIAALAVLAAVSAFAASLQTVLN